MAITRLKRKAKRNKSRAKNRVETIKRLNAKPVIKNVDIEDLKKDFAPVAEEKPAKKKAAPKKEAAPVAEAKEAPAKEEKKDEE
ncbi:hypothetical protein R9C00_22395 [Flammeovirgaceae bacterium SG7u.111]|nr:hypothetical protein [Flammeovirgaceae bacterium SG7u.132]WPO34454.1 hypothetical protein R9C00_22395 [Flammeovirgaceae bacterium SG7u.111]